MFPVSPQQHSANTSFEHDMSMESDLNSTNASMSDPLLNPTSSSALAAGEDEDSSNISPTSNNHAHTAPVSIHPALVKQAEIQRRISQERASAELHAQHHQQHLSSSPAATAALVGASASATPSPVTKRDSFRHSFVEIDHPLAQRSRPNGPSSNPIDEDGEEIDNEAASQAQQAQQQSLTHIIKKALMNASDADKIKEKRAAEAAKAAYSKAIAESEASIASADQFPNPTPQNTSPPAPIVAPAPLVPTTSISMSRCIKLLNWFVFYYSKNPSTYRSSAKSLVIQQRVTALAKLDYHVSVISNDSKNGAAASLAAAASVNPSLASHSTPAAADSGYEYCNTYPLELIIFENEKQGPYGVGEGDESSGSGHTLQSRVNDSAVLKPLFRLSRFSRVHGRFVIPVILVRNKNICRSSTLAIQAEAILNNVHAATKQIFGSFWDILSGGFGRGSSNSVGAAPSQGVQVGLEAQRGHDLQLLLHTATTYVEDLMVEHRKTKMGVPLTSSEKNEVWRYSNMKLNALPYPGCEFFTLYKMNQHSGLGLYFDWSQGFISSDLLLSNPCPMIPDEMLSCNGTLPPKSQDADGKPVAPTLSEENLYQWFEFQHDTHDHQREHEEKAKKEALEREQFLKNEAMKAPVSPSTADGPSASPPILSSAADELLDQLLGHSASSLDSDLATSTLPNGQSVSAEVVSSVPSSDASEVTSNGSTSASANGIKPTAAPATDAVAAVDSTTNVSSSPSSNSSAASSVSSSPLSSTSPISKQTHITSFSLYKSWDVVTLTKNYLLVLLAHVADESPNSGVLVHCISGWDRTPLFVSLLRLTLWADGEVHRSLSPLQMLYFTIAYDWCGFGHQVHNRLEKGEDIFYFCFDFLQYITNHKFSLQTASEMRSKKRSVEAELLVERSATPAPASASISSSTSPVAVAVPATSATAASSTSPHLEPVIEKAAAPKSALTSALKAAQANGLKPPPMRKSSSDGTGTLDARDDEEPSLIVESSSYSPVNVHSLPPASSSYTAVKPIPSLSSFIIESHEASASASNSNTEAKSSDTTNGVDGAAPSNSIPIASSATKDKSGESSSRESSSTTPIGESLPKDGALLDAAAMQAAASSQAASGQQISRVSSWTDLNHSTDSAASTARTRRASIEKHLPHASPANDQPHFHAPPNAPAQSLQRCEKLLAVRSLFMTCFHHVLPSTPAPSFPSPHAPFTAHAAAMREAARARKEHAHPNVKEAPVSNDKVDGKSASVTAPSSSDSTSAPASSTGSPANRLPVAAPVAAPVSKSGGWFSS